MKVSKNILEADSIIVSHYDRLILTDVYIRVQQNEIVGLLGRNGAGKSTLLNVIFGKTKADHQSIRINGNHLRHGFTTGNISMLPQKNMIPSGLKVSEAMRLFNITHQVIQAFAPELTKLIDQPVISLSGGERRFIELVLVLFSRTKFCLLDEPFSGLSPVVVERVIELMKEIRKDKGILITDHRYREVVSCSDRIYFMTNGTVKQIADPTLLYS